MSEYSRNYYKNNREKWKGYNSSDKYKQYHRNYFKEHKEEFAEKSKEYFKKFEGKYIYFICNEIGYIKYVGMSTNLYNRFHSHKHTKEKYDVEKDRVLFLDFSNDGITDIELYELEQFFIELYTPRLNNKEGNYDTNVLDILDNKQELIFKDFKLNNDNIIKPNEVYEIRDTLLKNLIHPTEEEKERIKTEKLFSADGVSFISNIETVKNYINLVITEEEYECMRDRIRKELFRLDYIKGFPVRLIYFPLKDYKNIELAKKGEIINYYNKLLKKSLGNYNIDKIEEILNEVEFNLYKKIKGVDKE